MANVEQFQNEAPLVTQRTGILATSSNAVARIREAIDQPGFRRAFPTLLASLTAVAAIVLYWGMQKPEMTTLYSSLSESEKSRVLNSLKNMGVDVQLDPATGVRYLCLLMNIINLEFLSLLKGCQNLLEVK